MSLKVLGGKLDPRVNFLNQIETNNIYEIYKLVTIIITTIIFTLKWVLLTTFILHSIVEEITEDDKYLYVVFGTTINTVHDIVKTSLVINYLL